MIEMSFPVQGDFYDRRLRKEQYRLKLGIQPDRFTITLSGGSLGAGPVLSSAKALDKAFPEAQLLIVAGRNEQLYDLLTSKFKDKRIKVYGFTDQMATLVRGSDVVVSKGGPSSIMEAFAAGRPVVVIGEVGMQEKGNGELTQRLGIGFHARSVNEMVSIVKSLTRDIEDENRVPTVNGSHEIAKLVLEHIVPLMAARA